MIQEEATSVSGVHEEVAAPVSEPVVDEQPEQAALQERQVPLAALESERAQRQQIQDELRIIKENLTLMQMRQNQPPPIQEPIINDDDVMTHGEFKKAASQFQSQIAGQLNEMQMSKKFPDYDEVVRKYLPEIIKDDPSIATTLDNSKDYNLAYRLAKTSDGYRRDQKQVKKNSDAQRILSNSEQTGSLSSVGGTSPISMVKRYKDMSDTDFLKEMAKNVGHA